MKHNNLSSQEQRKVYQDLLQQCNGVDWIINALEHAWRSYILHGWGYDGATFVKEHNNNYWEVAAFIHDYLNCIGYVGKEPDIYFLRVMIALNYSPRIIRERFMWMTFTWVNKLRHKLKGTFKGDQIPNWL